MKRVYFIIALISFLFSCSKQDIEQPLEPQNNDPLITVIVRSSGNSKNDVLGYGYDGLYGTADNVRGVRSLIIDLDRYKAGIGRDQLTGAEVSFPQGKIEEALTHGEGTISEVYEKNLDSFKKNIAANFNYDLSSVLWGSVQLSAEYDSTLETKKEYCFYKVDGSIYIRRLYLSSSSINRLKYFLTDEFLYALKNSSGEEILNNYGTHVLTDINLGGKLSLMASAEDKSAQQNELIRFSSGFFNALQASNPQNVEKSKSLKNTTVTLIQSGGSNIQTVEKHIDDNEAIDSNIFDYQAWAQGLNKDNAVLISSNKNRLVFVWDLIDDPLIRAKVYNAFVLKQQ